MPSWRRYAIGIAWLACGGTASAGQEPAAGQVTTPATTTGEVRLNLSPDGHFGAWLVAGPFDRSHVPDAEKATPSLGGSAGESQWRLAASDAALDLTAVLDARWGERFAFAGGTLRVEHAGRHY